ncbi:sensor histidine kinase [Georgenia alba]|uniref:histidine kinase n=1 Tax=Georgenia alba TaxID=2233858 RepID=A0ABW2Q6K9_9MICO
MATDVTPGKLTAWLNDPAEPHWERPRPDGADMRKDVLGTAIFMLVGLGMIVLTKSMGMRVEEEEAWRAYAATAAMIAPLALRRRFPITVLLVASGLFVGLSYLSAEASVLMPFQVAYFAALYAAVAWAPDRRLLWLALGLVLLAMALWIIMAFTTASAADEFGLGQADQAEGPLGQITAAVLYNTVMNFAYFGGAILFGRNSWRSALQRSRLVAQTDRVREQAGELARRAVVDERLRIGRELHDVVAHHIAVIGIQAGAARRVLGKDPAAASQALRTVEGSSRDAVSEMRSLLGVLRSETDTRVDRAPEPDLRDLARLEVEYRESGLAVEFHRAEDRPGDLDDVPAPLALSVYRTVQESLANVLRHSTAGTALVTLRTGRDDATTAERPGWVEVEVVDDGRPRSGTAGSGFGLRGIRERVGLHGGEAEIGPRRTGDGWRVRARFAVRVREAAPIA